MSLPVIIDTDPGIDDALALLYALASPELSVEAVTVVAGNVALEIGVRNALLTLEASGAKDLPPVAAGCDRPLRRPLIDASHVHGDDGLGGAADHEPALQPVAAHGVDVLLETLAARPGEVGVIALGPLTNLATALERDAAVVRQAREVVVMGGSMAAPGNVTPAAEYNFYADPEAAQAVLAAGLNLTVVGLDVTRFALLERERFERRTARSTHPAAKFAARVTQHYFDFNQSRRGISGCHLHDPLAVAVAADPTLVETRGYLAEVETEGRLTRGMLVADRRETAPEGLVRIATELDAQRFIDGFLDRVCPAP